MFNDLHFFYSHFVLIGSFALNLRILETVIFALSTKIDTHQYKRNHSSFFLVRCCLSHCHVISTKIKPCYIYKNKTSDMIEIIDHFMCSCICNRQYICLKYESLFCTYVRTFTLYSAYAFYKYI